MSLTNKTSFQQRETGLWYCEGDHHRSSDCEWQPLTEDDVRKLITSWEKYVQILLNIKRDLNEHETDKNFYMLPKSTWEEACDRLLKMDGGGKQ